MIRLNDLPDLTVGDSTIVHAGFALTRPDEAEADKTIALMREVGLPGGAPDSPAQLVTGRGSP